MSLHANLIMDIQRAVFRRAVSLTAVAILGSIAFAGPSYGQVRTTRLIAAPYTAFGLTPEEIAAVEAKLKPLPAPLDSYNRFYAGMMDRWERPLGSPQRWVQFLLVPTRAGSKGTAHIIDPSEIPLLKGVGCVGGMRLFANGPSLGRLKCTSDGFWLPPEKDIAALERKIAATRGADISYLSVFARYYAGVTRDGVKLISGYIAWQGHPDLTIASDAELPDTQGGGCMQQFITYNPETGNLQIKCGIQLG